MDQTPGQLLREARRRHGVTQAGLARRASTTQSSISRIERDQVSPSVETLRALLYLLGDDLALSATPRNSGIDRSMLRQRIELGPSQRIESGRAFADQVIANLPDWRKREPV